jgi:hypothetical protein
MTRVRDGGTTRGDATTSSRTTMRGRRSERTTRDVGIGNNDCSDDSNSDSDGDTDNGDGDSGEDDSNSDSGGGNSNSGGRKYNELKPAAEKAATAVNAAFASTLLAS